MADGVQVQGPDGQQYQFPAGTDKNAAIAYFKKKGIGASAAAPADSGLDYATKTPEAQRSFFGRLLSPENIARSSEPPAGAPWYSPERIAAGAVRAVTSPYSLLRGPTTPEEAGTQFSGGYPAMVAQRLFGPTGEVAGKTQQSYREFESAIASGNEDAIRKSALKTLGYGAATAVPVIGPGIAGIAERAPHDPLGATTDVLGNFELGRLMGPGEKPTLEQLAQRQIRSQLRQMTKQQILEQAHAKLNSQVEPTNQLIRDVPLAGMRREVGQHVQGLDAGDVAASPQGRPQVNTSSLHPLLDDITNTHRSAAYSSRFNQATEEVQSLPANAYWKDVHDVKMNVRSLWAKAAEGSPEKSALNKLSEGLETILADRAEEIGQTKQYNKYRELTRAYHAYESNDNVIGKLLDTSLGKDYFKLLRDPAYADQLSAASKDFAKYGLPADTLSNLAQRNSQLHDFVNTTKGSGFRGKIASIMQEPLAAGAGMLGGRALGTALGFPTLGGLIGAMKGAEFAETAGARRALAEQGLAPSRELIGAPVVPGPAGPGAAAQRGAGGAAVSSAAPQPPAQAISDLVGTINDLFPRVSPKMAEAMARAALDQAGGDVQKAAENLARRQSQMPLPGSQSQTSTVPGSQSKTIMRADIGGPDIIEQRRQLDARRAEIDTQRYAPVKVAEKARTDAYGAYLRDPADPSLKKAYETARTAHDAARRDYYDLKGDDLNELTSIAQQLQKLPKDPHVGSLRQLPSGKVVLYLPEESMQWWQEAQEVGPNQTLWGVNMPKESAATMREFLKVSDPDNPRIAGIRDLTQKAIDMAGPEGITVVGNRGAGIRKMVSTLREELFHSWQSEAGGGDVDKMLDPFAFKRLHEQIPPDMMKYLQDNGYWPNRDVKNAVTETAAKIAAGEPKIDPNEAAKFMDSFFTEFMFHHGGQVADPLIHIENLQHVLNQTAKIKEQFVDKARSVGYGIDRSLQDLERQRGAGAGRGVPAPAGRAETAKEIERIRSGQSSEETAPIYDQKYRGSVDIESIEAIKDDPKLSVSLREAAKGVYEAVMDSGMSIDNAMRLNGTDELAKQLGGKFEKTINAVAPSPKALPPKAGRQETAQRIRDIQTGGSGKAIPASEAKIIPFENAPFKAGKYEVRPIKGGFEVSENGRTMILSPSREEAVKLAKQFASDDQWDEIGKREIEVDRLRNTPEGKWWNGLGYEGRKNRLDAAGIYFKPGKNLEDAPLWESLPENRRQELSKGLLGESKQYEQFKKEQDQKVSQGHPIGIELVRRQLFLKYGPDWERSLSPEDKKMFMDVKKIFYKSTGPNK